MCEGDCWVDLDMCSLKVYKDECLQRKYFVAVYRSWWNCFQWPARGIDYQCVGSQEHICCVQVVGEGGGVEFRVFLSAGSSHWVSFHSCSGRISWTPAHFSFPCVKRTPNAASQLFHSVKQLSHCWGRPGFQLQSEAHIYEFLQKVHAAQGLTDASAHIHQTSQNSNADGRDISRSPVLLVLSVKCLIDGLQFVDRLWLRTEPSIVFHVFCLQSWQLEHHIFCLFFFAFLNVYLFMS